MAQVSHGCIFYCFPWVLYCVFCFDINVLVARDLRHKYAQFAWGVPFRGPPGSWLRSSRLHCGDWFSFDDDCRRRMSIVVIITTSSWCLCCIRRLSRFVALRLIVMALLVALEERLSHERFGASQWWCWLHPLQSVLALIFDCAHHDWQSCCNCA